MMYERSWVQTPNCFLFFVIIILIYLSFYMNKLKLNIETHFNIMWETL